MASTKMQPMKSRACSEMCEGSRGLVGWVAILKMAAMASYSAHGGFSVNISTTVQPRLLKAKLGTIRTIKTPDYDVQVLQEP